MNSSAKMCFVHSSSICAWGSKSVPVSSSVLWEKLHFKIWPWTNGRTECSLMYIDLVFKYNELSIYLNYVQALSKIFAYIFWLTMSDTIALASSSRLFLSVCKTWAVLHEGEIVNNVTMKHFNKECFYFSYLFLS